MGKIHHFKVEYNDIKQKLYLDINFCDLKNFKWELDLLNDLGLKKESPNFKESLHEVKTQPKILIKYLLINLKLRLNNLYK